MPGTREKSWSELRVGIVVVAVGALAGVAVFLAGARRGPFLPDTYPLYLDLREAGGIRVGSPVRVGGVPAGEVADVEIIPAGSPEASDTLAPLTAAPDLRDIRIHVSIQERFRPWITAGSRGQLASIGLGGERYVKISAGDVADAPIPAGGEIPAVGSVDFDLVLTRLSRALNETMEIAALSEEIRDRLGPEGGGSLARFIDKESPIYPRLQALQRESESLLATLEDGPGFIPRWSADPRLQSRIDSLMAAMDRISGQIDSEEGALHAWADPEALRAAVEETRAEVVRLDEALGSGRGTAGRLINDQELWVQIRVLQQRIAELVEAFRSDPLGFVDIDLF